jgi:subtilisin family serine protease
LSSDAWFRELDKLNFVLRCKPNEEDTLYTPARIAILDTGVIEDYVESVKAYKDFIGKNDDDWQDNTGHGTNAVRLILKVYNAAEIYVGRVFENSKATRNTAALMAQVCNSQIFGFFVAILITQAIRHAKDIWKVDIIVMPSGFESINRDMTWAIDETNHARILVFAAASNYGNLREISFPGRLYMYNKLICMFSTDSNARCLPNFNPSASSAPPHSFAILGENIVLPYVKEPLSGTSFATMIGAALAGRILDFSRQSDNRGRIRNAEVLNTVEGMSAVFAKMAPGGKDNGYDCMAPWKILHSVDEDLGKRRKDERAHVCETISRALEDIYRT